MMMMFSVFGDGQFVPGVAHLNFHSIFWKKTLTNWRQAGKYPKDVESCLIPYFKKCCEDTRNSVYTGGKKAYGRHYNKG